MEEPCHGLLECIIDFNELRLNVSPPYPLMCHMSYLCYLYAMKLEASAHSVLSRLKGKPVFYGVGENQADTREVACGYLI